jgi:hypothetical protein
MDQQEPLKFRLILCSRFSQFNNNNRHSCLKQRR